MNRREIRRRAREFLRGCDLQTLSNVNDLAAHLGQLRRTVVKIQPWIMPAGGPTGLWLSSPGTDCVFYQARTTITHQGQSVMHEFGHIVLDHKPDGAVEESPDDVLSRGGQCMNYSDPRETEAEIFANVVREWVATLARPGMRTTTNQVGQSLDGALGHPIGWLR